MTRKGTTKTGAREVARTYGTAAHGIGHARLVQLIRQHGLEGAIQQLEAMGLKPVAALAVAESEVGTSDVYIPAALITQVNGYRKENRLPGSMKARLDAYRSSAPKTRIVHHPPPGKLAGPGMPLVEPELEDVASGARTPMTAQAEEVLVASNEEGDPVEFRGAERDFVLGAMSNWEARRRIAQVLEKRAAAQPKE